MQFLAGHTQDQNTPVKKITDRYSSEAMIIYYLIYSQSQAYRLATTFQNTSVQRRLSVILI